MKLAGVIITASITAAISVPATYQIAIRKNTSERCTVASNKDGQSASQLQAKADSDRPDQSEQSTIERKHPSPDTPGHRERGPAIAEYNGTPETENTDPASEQAKANADYETFKQQKEAIDQLRQFTKNHDTASRDRLLEKRFDAEPVDYDWAAKKESELLDFFGTAKGLEYAVPESLNCKSKNCQVTVPVTGQRQGSSIFDAFRRAVTEKTAGSTTPIVYFSNTNDKELVMYVSRNGKSDLFEPPQ